jgi:hypothetical protein
MKTAETVPGRENIERRSTQGGKYEGWPGLLEAGSRSDKSLFHRLSTGQRASTPAKVQSQISANQSPPVATGEFRRVADRRLCCKSNQILRHPIGEADFGVADLIGKTFNRLVASGVDSCRDATQPRVGWATPCGRFPS